ncbi:PKD domain-containing protein, partial [Methanoculleus sp.]|uniref:PKD domain-containing protein n=1 Tax=Methanoculleus sp. TaxID=90427 RepID=UPI002CBEBC71
LTPGTLYHYRIVVGNTTLGDRTFRTFPEDGGFTFIVYGDTQLPANIKIVADRIADEDPLFILHTGDQVSAVESVDEWNNFFSSNRRLLANTTIYTTLGNHEYNDTVYYETFGLPQWYSFVCADARFAVLDDNFASNPLPETAWLARDLTNDTAWKFVANHHPPYSSTSDRAGGWLYPRAWWGQIMQDNGVTAVFNGHVHAYERYIVDGITYLVTGTGAGSLHPLGPANERPAGYQNSLVHTLGYTKITVHDNGTATGQFVQVARLDPNNSSQVLEVYPPGTAFETYTLTPRARGADLAAVSLDVPAGIVAGNACTVNGTVENLGGTVAGACPVTLAADGDLIGNLTVDPLAPGETAEVSFTWTPAAAGEAVLTLSVDPASTVPDINRTNNIRTVTVTVTEPGAPVANFTANVTAGDAPLAVQFTDASTGGPTSWSWTFGDGGTSDQQNPVHVYTAAGVYTVNLTVTNDFGSDSEVKTGYITVTEPDTPVADFTGTPTTGDAPLEVRFADNSTGKPVQWLWEFGDGRIATTKNPITTYRQPGTYTVNLTATYGDGSSSRSTKADYITVTRPNPVASFTADQTRGNADLPVQFTDTSTGSPTSWAWNFGDGATSTDQNPAHTYTTAGTYTVTLTVSRDGGPASTKTGQIVVKPVAGFTAGTTRGYAPFAVQFTDASTGNPDTHSWDFGDGATSSDPNPAHTYTTAGTYTVTLTVTGGGQAHTEVKAAYITAVDPGVPPAAEFRADTTGGYAPLVVRFFDQSQGDVDEWLWNFGDGATSAGQNPEHAYTAAGTYTVTLTAQKAGAQSDTRTKTAYVTVDDPKPVADFTVTRLRGEAPLTVQFTDNSTGAPPLTRAWDFGDGTNSTLRNPTHVFDHDGEGARTYTVTLTVTNSGGSDVKTTAITVVAPPQKEDVTDRVDQTNATATEDISVTYQGLTLEIPKGHDAKQADGSPITEFSVGVAPDLEEPPAGTIEIGGKAFKLGPEGAKFNPKIPITITFTQDEWEELFGDGRTTKLQRYDGQNWIELENQTRDDTTFTITGYTDSFSVFAPVTTTTTPEPTSTPTQPRTSGSGSSTATVTSTGTAKLLTASWGGVLRPYLVYVDGKFAHLSLETGVTALDDAGSPLSGVGIAPVSTLPGASSLAFSGYAVDCSPAGATFSPAIDLVFTFTGDEWAALLGKTGGDSARLVVQGYDDATGTWTACPTNVDADARTVTASVSHFSTYALFVGTATEAPVPTEPTPTVPAAAATTPPVPPAETGESPLVWIALAVVIVVALAGYLLWKRR